MSDSALHAQTAAAQAYAGQSPRRHYPCRVFDRAGLPCPGCQAEIAVDRSSDDGHLTWYCPKCQTLGHEETLFGAGA